MAPTPAGPGRAPQERHGAAPEHHGAAPPSTEPSATLRVPHSGTSHGTAPEQAAAPESPTGGAAEYGPGPSHPIAHHGHVPPGGTEPAEPRDAYPPVLRPLRAVVFDTDGVITDSAGLHAAAWKVAFDACLQAAPPDDRAPADGPPDDRAPGAGPSDDRARSGGPPHDRARAEGPPDARHSGTEDRHTGGTPTPIHAPPAGAHLTTDRRPFDPREDYRRYVDGRSRLDGAAAFLAARGLALPDGRADDPPGTATVRAVAARKEQVFTDRLREHGIDPYPGTVRLLAVLARHGVPCAAVSASRHATELLTRAGVREHFAAVVDGVEAARLELPGKPHPALFLEAARRLGVPTADAAVIEDALAGVEAGRRGGFALVIGVDRTAGPTSAADLREHGADLVVRDLADLLAPRPGPATAGE